MIRGSALTRAPACCYCSHTNRILTRPITFVIGKPVCRNLLWLRSFQESSFLLETVCLEGSSQCLRKFRVAPIFVLLRRSSGRSRRSNSCIIAAHKGSRTYGKGLHRIGRPSKFPPRPRRFVSFVKSDRPASSECHCSFTFHCDSSSRQAANALRNFFACVIITKTSVMICVDSADVMRVIG